MSIAGSERWGATRARSLRIDGPSRSAMSFTFCGRATASQPTRERCQAPLSSRCQVRDGEAALHSPAWSGNGHCVNTFAWASPGNPHNPTLKRTAAIKAGVCRLALRWASGHCVAIDYGVPGRHT